MGRHPASMDIRGIYIKGAAGSQHPAAQVAPVKEVVPHSDGATGILIIATKPGK